MATQEETKIIALDCSGPCVGTGIGYKIVEGACPNPGNADYKKRVRDSAKAKAYSTSQQGCTGEHCECYGQYRALIPEQCVTLKDADNKDVCLYFAAYAYEGECSILV